MNITRRAAIALVFAFAAVLSCAASQVLPPERAILILISIDAFRLDYLDGFKPPTLTRLANEGVRAEGLIPQFPSKTFPNHYTIVTGLTLAPHRIISHNMQVAGIAGEH